MWTLFSNKFLLFYNNQFSFINLGCIYKIFQKYTNNKKIPKEAVGSVRNIMNYEEMMNDEKMLRIIRNTMSYQEMSRIMKKKKQEIRRSNKDHTKNSGVTKE
jgi:hypothetical protein